MKKEKLEQLAKALSLKDVELLRTIVNKTKKDNTYMFLEWDDAHGSSCENLVAWRLIFRCPASWQCVHPTFKGTKFLKFWRAGE